MCVMFVVYSRSVWNIYLLLTRTTILRFVLGMKGECIRKVFGISSICAQLFLVLLSMTKSYDLSVEGLISSCVRHERWQQGEHVVAREMDANKGEVFKPSKI